MAFSQIAPLTPEDVERASKCDGKTYELINAKLRAKQVGTRSLFIAGQIATRLNDALYPTYGFAAQAVPIYCFSNRSHGRKPDVAYVSIAGLPDCRIPEGDLTFAPDLVVEVLSPRTSAYDVQERLEDYLSAGIPVVWIVHPDRRTIRVYRQDGSTQLYRADDTITGEAVLPGFSLKVSEVFPAVAVQSA